MEETLSLRNESAPVVCTSVSFATQQQGEQTEAGDVFQYILRCCAGELVSAQRHSLTGNTAPE